MPDRVETVTRLIAVDLPSDPDDVIFAYDADEVRVSRAHGDYTTVFIAGLMGIDLDDTTVTETRTFYAFAATPVAVRTHEDPATVYFFDNHLGSVTAAWDDTKDVHTLQRYYPWGTNRGGTGTLPSDHRYTGQISDDTAAPSGGTGLLYYNARYYDPTIGAFAAADTIVPDFGAPSDLNRYAYVRNSPVNYDDPTGHCGVTCQPFIIGDSAEIGDGWYEGMPDQTVNLQQVWDDNVVKYNDIKKSDALLPLDRWLRENPSFILTVGALALCPVSAVTCAIASEVAVIGTAFEHLADTGNWGEFFAIVAVGTLLVRAGYLAVAGPASETLSPIAGQGVRTLTNLVRSWITWDIRSGDE